MEPVVFMIVFRFLVTFIAFIVFAMTFLWFVNFFFRAFTTLITFIAVMAFVVKNSLRTAFFRGAVSFSFIIKTAFRGVDRCMRLSSQYKHSFLMAMVYSMEIRLNRIVHIH